MVFLDSARVVVRPCAGRLVLVCPSVLCEGYRNCPLGSTVRCSVEPCECRYTHIVSSRDTTSPLYHREHSLAYPLRCCSVAEAPTPLENVVERNSKALAHDSCLKLNAVLYRNSNLTFLPALINDRLSQQIPIDASSFEDSARGEALAKPIVRLRMQVATSLIR